MILGVSILKSVSRIKPLVTKERPSQPEQNKVEVMSLEVLAQLESKIQTAVDTITLLQMELEEVKQKNQGLEQESTSLRDNCSELEQQNQQMREEHDAWQERIRILLDKMEDVE